jgi:hypothetical protein
MTIKSIIIGERDEFDLEHRCYNGVCLTTATGCLSASLFNSIIGLSIISIIITGVIGVLYMWLYIKSRRATTYQPVLWLYILLGVILLVITWLFNGGVDGSDTFVSMVALVALMVVLTNRRYLLVSIVFFPTMTMLFLLEYLFPDLISTYINRDQRFLDVYLTFVVATIVIYSIVSLILNSHNQEKRNLDEANRLLEGKMAALNTANKKLEEALTKVQVLSGLLPICSSCKKIRDDEGYWNQIEGYIQKHSSAQFSHGICPECAKKYYPDLDIVD